MDKSKKKVQPLQKVAARPTAVLATCNGNSQPQIPKKNSASAKNKSKKQKRRDALQAEKENSPNEPVDGHALESENKKNDYLLPLIQPFDFGAMKPCSVTENSENLPSTTDADHTSTAYVADHTTTSYVSKTNEILDAATETTDSNHNVIQIVASAEQNATTTTTITEQFLNEPKTPAESSTIDEFVGAACNVVPSIEVCFVQEMDEKLNEISNKYVNLYANLVQYEQYQESIVQRYYVAHVPVPTVAPVLPEKESLFSVLPHYVVSETIKRLSQKNFQKNASMSADEVIVMNKLDQLQETGLTVDNYADMLSTLIAIEDYTCQKEQSRFSKNHTQVFHVDQDLYMFRMTCHEKPAASLILNDRIWLVSTTRLEKVNGSVVEMTDNSIIFRANSPLVHCATSLYKIHFVLNRLTARLQQRAMERVDGFNLAPLLFPNSTQWRFTPRENRLYLTDDRINNNAEQLKAVRDIVFGIASDTMPYLLFGLPGTGKTQVLAESIYQVWSNHKNSRILVCAPSNDVVDELALRLLHCFGRFHVPPDMMRMYATKRMNAVIPPELTKLSNVFETETPNNLLRLLLKNRIILSTLSASGRIALVNMPPDYFTHIFIDECQSASETMQLIPIVGICSSLCKIYPHIVLAGDTQQLGPILRSTMSRKMNFGVSMMERLSHYPIYAEYYPQSENPHTTMLVKSYRTHHKILKPANDLFYQGKMVASAFTIQCKLGVGLVWLPSPEFPLFIEHVPGYAQREIGGYSFHNLMEVGRVINYVEMVLFNSGGRFEPTDIGIIAPYKAQCILIAFECRIRGWQNIKVGSAVEFQSLERPVIIISTVRTARTKLGFLDEPKRINVMLTRAIALMILIGDTTILATNPNWRHLLVYCRNNNALIKYQPQTKPDRR